ncbi:MAG: hypothetical protein IT337_10185 [Thermomicrobiales bacterium]|nr:hypothetical protein [Thermomicrobiales bacterium]
MDRQRSATAAKVASGFCKSRRSRRDLIKQAAALGISLPMVGASLAASRSVAAQADGSIVISLADEPLTLENWNSFSIYGHPILRNIMEALTNRDPATNELVGELATSWERTDDLTWRFTLRPGVTFHNGEPLTAEVAAYGLNYTWDPANGFEILAILGPELTAEAVDDLTLDVKTAEPDPILPTRLYFSPLPSMKQLTEDPESAVDNPIGTGPYKFVEWTRGQDVKITANPDWWGDEAEDAGGAVTIQDGTFVFRTESAVRAAQIVANEAQATHNLAPEDCAVVPVCTSVPSIETLILRMDTMNEAMKDIRVRQAIAQAVDVKAAVEAVLPGSTAATQIYGPSALGYNDALQPYPYDLEAAKALIQEAAADGVPVDAPITLVTTSSTARGAELVQYVANQLQQIGLNASSKVIESAEFRPQVYGLGQDKVPADRGWIVLLQHGNELMDASASIDRYYSCNPDSDSTFCNPDIEKQIEAARLLTGEERDKAYQELGALIQQQYAIIPVAHLVINYGMVANLNWEPRMDAFMLLKEMSYS